MPNGPRTQITLSSSTLAFGLVHVKLEWDLWQGCLSLWDEIQSFKPFRYFGLVYPFAHDGINFPITQGVDVNVHTVQREGEPEGKIEVSTSWKNGLNHTRLVGLMEKRKL